jgi:hypothetical protein
VLVETEREGESQGVCERREERLREKEEGKPYPSALQLV